MTRRINPRKAKIHQSYTVEEAALLFGRSIPTVRSWIKKGLPIMRGQIPHLILGAELREYLDKTQRSSKRPLAPNQLYCLKCRKPQAPYGGLVDYVPISAKRGRLEGLCPTCEGICNRFASRRQLPQFAEIFDLTIRPHKSA
ncbi:MAG: helix-turn-helix domain-containing protein [Rhodobacteraceae bacterium]|nr:helix-turn-helix domain-containing protein [Paracoccaceae bacterium]